MSEHREWRLGAHQVRFEPPDLVWVTFQGPISLQEVIWTVSLSRELGSQRAFVMVADVTENTSLDAEGRRYASEHTDPEWFSSIIYVGARLIHRAAAKGIQLVHNLLGKRHSPVYFASTPAEARDLIARLRSA